MPPPVDDPPSDDKSDQSENGEKSVNDVPERVTGIAKVPHHHDGTPFPEKFLEHETVIGYPGDMYPGDGGTDKMLELVSHIEHEGLRCCIIEVIALRYYGSERMQNVCFLQSEPSNGLLTTHS